MEEVGGGRGHQRPARGARDVPIPWWSLNCVSDTAGPVIRAWGLNWGPGVELDMLLGHTLGFSQPALPTT